MHLVEASHEYYNFTHDGDPNEMICLKVEFETNENMSTSFDKQRQDRHRPHCRNHFL